MNQLPGHFYLHLRKVAFLLFVMIISFPGASNLLAQDAAPVRTPEELKELFGYCEKTDLIKQLKFSPEMADKVGEIDYWSRLQQVSLDANTNTVFATAGELREEVNKKYKAIRLSDEQFKALIDFKRARLSNPNPCAVIELNTLHIFDTLPVPRALLMYKSKYRKMLIDKLGINGRQADMIFETEVWKQKESLNTAAIPVADFNRIRKTVAMYAEREKRYRALSLSEEQVDAVIQFFTQLQL